MKWIAICLNVFIIATILYLFAVNGVPKRSPEIFGVVVISAAAISSLLASWFSWPRSSTWDSLKAAMKDRGLIIIAVAGFALGYLAGCQQNRNRWEFIPKRDGDLRDRRFDRATGKLYHLDKTTFTWESEEL